MTGGHFVFVESNTTGTGAEFLTKTRDLGLEPVLITKDPSRYGYLDGQRFDVLVSDTSGIGPVFDSVRKLRHVRGMMSSSEYYVATAASVARRLRLPGPSPMDMRRCRSKKLQRLHLSRAGVPIPRFAEARSAVAAARIAAVIGYPVVVKPTFGSGSIGVRVCTTEPEVVRHASQLLKSRTNERGLRLPREILIESYIDGPEYSVEMFTGEVVGITRKYLGPPPSFIEIGHDFPADLDPNDRVRVSQVARDAARALGATFAAAHVEVRAGEAGPIVIEVNPRLAGGCIPQLIQNARGIDLVYQSIRRSAGLSAELAPRHDRASSVGFIVAPKRGRLTEISGLLDARALRDVTEVSSYRDIGDTVGGSGDFRDRIGHIITVAGDTTQARASVDAALSRLGVDVEVIAA